MGQAIALAFAAGGLTLWVCATAAPASAQRSEFLGLGDLPGGLTGSRAADVSPNGQWVAGTSSSAAQDLGEGFVWSRDTGLIPLGDLPGSFAKSEATGVSDDGRVAVGSVYSDDGTVPFRWTPEVGIVSLGGLNPPGPGNVRVNDGRGRAISADGAVLVGETRAREVRSNVRFHEGFVFTDATGMVGLGSFDGPTYQSVATAVTSDGGIVVGHSVGEGFVWTREDGLVSLGRHPAGGGLEPLAISADGRVIGGTASRIPSLGRGTSEAFLWTERGGLVGLGFLPARRGSLVGTSSRVLGLSGDGRVAVGVARDQLVGPQAIVWTHATGMRRLDEVLGAERVSEARGWALHEATDISADGRTIVGSGVNPDGDTEAWLLRRPLPAEIDVKRFRRRGGEHFRVRIAATAFLDVADVDLQSLRFGPGAAEPLQARLGERARRISAVFEGLETGIGISEPFACLDGDLVDGTPFAGCGRIPHVGGPDPGADQEGDPRLPWEAPGVGTRRWQGARSSPSSARAIERNAASGDGPAAGRRASLGPPS